MEKELRDIKTDIKSLRDAVEVLVYDLEDCELCD